MRLIINQGHSVPVGGIWKNQGEEFEGNPDDYPKGAVTEIKPKAETPSPKPVEKVTAKPEISKE